MQRRTVFTLVMASALVPAAAMAEDDRPLFMEGASIELGGGASTPNLAGATFEGVGRVARRAPLSTFRSTGRALGLVQPSFGTFDAHLYYTRVPFYLGLVLSLGWGGADATASPSVASVANPTSDDFVLAGGEAGLEYPFGRFGVRLGEVAPYREVDVPLDGYKATACDEGLCYPSAGSKAFAARTRAALAWFPLDEGSGGYGAGAGLSVYGAIDEVPAIGWSAGLALTLHIGAYKRSQSAE